MRREMVLLKWSRSWHMYFRETAYDFFFFLVKIIFTLWTFTGGNFILKQILTNHNLNPIHRKNFLFPLSGPHHSGGLGRPSHLVTGFPSPLLSQRHCPLPGPADGHGEQGSTTWKRTSTELHLLQVKRKLVKTRISALKSAKNQRKPAGDYTAVLFLTFYSRGIFSEKVHKSQAHKKVNFYKLSTPVYQVWKQHMTSTPKAVLGVPSCHQPSSPRGTTLLFRLVLCVI